MKGAESNSVKVSELVLKRFTSPRSQIRSLRGQHHEADSCCFSTRVGSEPRMARGRFTRLHRESGVGTGLAATGTEAKSVCFVSVVTTLLRLDSVVVVVVQ